MGRPIDETDRAIIACLQEDSRTPSAEIARRVGVAERTVRARIDRLVQDKIIRLVAVVNPHAIGYTVTADVFLEVELGRIQEVAEQVAQYEEVSYVGLTTGDRDISLQLFAPSVEAIYDFVTERLNHLPGVTRARTFVIPRVIKSSYQWRLPQAVQQAPNRSESASHGQNRRRATAAAKSAPEEGRGAQR
ncbi:MAG: Lrp/AsnC family transcriptional regulator [Thermomicrobiaceae bacterium]|nr:Lrp/AsnC family transcriptional regulator [Thermomicrobiaceae bacterium]